MTVARFTSHVDALSVAVAQFVVAFVCAESVYTATHDAAPPAPWWPCGGLWLLPEAVHLAYEPWLHDSVTLLVRAAGAQVRAAQEPRDLTRSRTWAGDTMPGHDAHAWPAAAAASLAECLPPSVVRSVLYRRRGVPAQVFERVAHLDAMHRAGVVAVWARLPTRENPSRAGLQLRGDGWRLTVAVQGRDDIERPAAALDAKRPFAAVCEHCGTSGHRAASFGEMTDAATLAGWSAREADDGAALLACPACEAG